MSTKRMTANPVKPTRYRAGKPTGASSESDSGSESDEQTTSTAAARKRPVAQAPQPRGAGKIISTGVNGKINTSALNGTQDDARAAAARKRAEVEAKAKEEGFVTESEGSEEGSDDEEESGSEEDSSSEEEAPRRLMVRPKFVPKSQRQQAPEAAVDDTATAREASAAQDEEAAHKAARDLVQAQLQKDALAKANARAHWESDDENPIALSDDSATSDTRPRRRRDDVDDTDDLDPAAEYAAWKLRELKRLRRARVAIEEREALIAETERRNALSVEERRAEDEAHLAKQAAAKEAAHGEKEASGGSSFMQRYLHKGAFFMDDETAKGLAGRNVMGARFVDEIRDRESLPKSMQMRDMSKLGKKGASKYRDLRSEDTGRWGQFEDPRRKGFDYKGERMGERWKEGAGGGEGGRADEDAGQGANALPLGPRKRKTVDAEEESAAGSGRTDSYRPSKEDKGGDDRSKRRRSRTRSPRRRDHRDRSRDRDRRPRRDSRSMSRSRSPRRRSPIRHRD